MIRLKEILAEEKKHGYEAIRIKINGSKNWKYQKIKFKNLQHLLKIMSAEDFMSGREKTLQKFLDTSKTPPYIYINPFSKSVYDEDYIDWAKSKTDALSQYEDSMDEI